MLPSTMKYNKNIITKFIAYLTFFRFGDLRFLVEHFLFFCAVLERERASLYLTTAQI